MTFGKSRYDKSYDYELLRYCTNGSSVVGGPSKLFKQFISEYRHPSVVSYSDRMWNTGNLYFTLGFEYLGSSPPAPWYTKNYVSFENRISNQKHKLKNKLEAGYDRIWDCGSMKWGYKK
jgi:hypothetical protein